VKKKVVTLKLDWSSLDTLISSLEKLRKKHGENAVMTHEVCSPGAFQYVEFMLFYSKKKNE
jgi:hypothetical protein